MEKIKPIEIEGEKIYLRKSNIFGWGVVHPNKNDDGTINYFNLLTGGSWIKLFILIAAIVIILGIFYEYSSNLKYCADILGKINLQYNISGYDNLNLSPELMRARESLRAVPNITLNYFNSSV